MKQMIHTAFETPVNFPQISQIVYLGDKVAIVPDSFVVRRPNLLADFVSEIIADRLSPTDITILLPEQELKQYEKNIRQAIPHKYHHDIVFAEHNSANPAHLAMLAVAKDDSPIKFNRTLVDADVVIPLERYEAVPGMGYFGMQGVLYPRFTDIETQKRFLFADAQKNRKKLLADLEQVIQEAVCALGVLMTVQIVVDFQDQISKIIIGDTNEIKKQLKNLFVENL
ncbi:MAG: lactate racemase domain-containing protein [Planctomycetaceae bacterium]|jgi:nickel-dependent lactate racemase|nr:lactate racemase domain-containing protein [Planctomycetaceae bacterium]